MRCGIGSWIGQRLLDRPASEYRRLRQGARDHTRANVDYAQLIQWRKLPVNWDS